jgi:hypothetical protein
MPAAVESRTFCLPVCFQKIQSRTLVLPVALCGCEHRHIGIGIWAEGVIFHWYIFRRERLKMFESRVLRNVFGPERDEETGDCRRCVVTSFMICSLHYIRVIKSSRMRWAVHVARQG